MEISNNLPNYFFGTKVYKTWIVLRIIVDNITMDQYYFSDLCASFSRFSSLLTLLLVFPSNFIYSYWRIITHRLMFFHDTLEVILNIWSWLWSIWQCKFFLPCGRYFKSIVLYGIYFIFPCIVYARIW